jgi:hypothetical protein
MSPPSSAASDQDQFGDAGQNGPSREMAFEERPAVGNGDPPAHARRAVMAATMNDG